MLHSSFKKEMRVMGIWRKVFLLSSAAGERRKTVPAFVGGERKFVRCKDRTGNLNRICIKMKKNLALF